MNNFTERTWTMVTISQSVAELMKTYAKFPPRKMQSEVYTGSLTLSQYERMQSVREQLKNEGFNLSMPTGN